MSYSSYPIVTGNFTNANRKMKLNYNKLLFIVLLILSHNSYGQDMKDLKKWFIVLPLRFTHLQNNNTMLSGIKLGRTINHQFQASVSVYHSFYLNSFKSEADINGFDEQPRLFINCFGGELVYYFFNRARVSTSAQLLLGWGFIKYDLKDLNFTSKQINYFAVEPVINTEYKMNNTTYIGLGVGYRPILSNKQISYSSNVSNGEISVYKSLPNGVNIILTVKAFF